MEVLKIIYIIKFISVSTTLRLWNWTSNVTVFQRSQWLSPFDQNIISWKIQGKKLCISVNKYLQLVTFKAQNSSSVPSNKYQVVKIFWSLLVFSPSFLDLADLWGHGMTSSSKERTDPFLEVTEIISDKVSPPVNFEWWFHNHYGLDSVGPFFKLRSLTHEEIFSYRFAEENSSI